MPIPKRKMPKLGNDGPVMARLAKSIKGIVLVMYGVRIIGFQEPNKNSEEKSNWID